jgi:hypothetical protein
VQSGRRATCLLSEPLGRVYSQPDGHKPQGSPFALPTSRWRKQVFPKRRRTTTLPVVTAQETVEHTEAVMTSGRNRPAAWEEHSCYPCYPRTVPDGQAACARNAAAGCGFANGTIYRLISQRLPSANDLFQSPKVAKSAHPTDCDWVLPTAPTARVPTIIFSPEDTNQSSSRKLLCSERGTMARVQV